MVCHHTVVDKCWGNAQSSSNNEFVWTYFGGSTGFFRMQPAGKMPKSYDQTHRSWYMAALANRWEDGDAAGYGLTVSTPYNDAFGAGEVITMSQVVKRGGFDASDPVAGVVGVDLKLSTLKREVDAVGDCGRSNVECMLLDETGHIIYHKDFTTTREADANVFIASKHREVANELINKGKLTQNTCFDYGSGLRKTSYNLNTNSADGGSLSCGNWALAKLGRANVYLLALSSNGCIVENSKREIGCKPCSVENCNDWLNQDMDTR